MKLSVLSTRKISRIGGLTLILMTLFSIFAFGIVISSIYVEGNAIETAQNIALNRNLYLSGNISWLLVLVMDIVVAYAFYRVLLDQTPVLAKWSGLSRILYTGVFAIGIVGLFNNDVEMFMTFWSWGLIIIGFHLIITGIAVLNSKTIPKFTSRFIGFFLIIAGLSYSLIHGIYQLTPLYSYVGRQIETLMAVPMTLGELSFGIWMLVKGK